MDRSTSRIAVLVSVSLLACGGPTPSSNTGKEALGTNPTASAAPAAATPTTSTQETPTTTHSDGMVTLRGKSSPIAKMRLTKEDGQFYFNADDEAGEGVGLRLGADLKVGAKIERDRGVTGHVLENGSPVNVGDSSSFSFEVTKLELGTWEKPGKCSGRFSAEVKTPDLTIQASGPFTDIECFSISM
jgi:hypothetical protein